MKKILIIDDRGITQHPDFTEYKFVQFIEKCSCPGNLIPDNYDTAFIHQRNNIEISWAKQNLPIVFVFSGGKDYPERSRNNVVNLPRTIYKKYILHFLDVYKTKDIINPEIFWGDDG